MEILFLCKAIGSNVKLPEQLLCFFFFKVFDRTVMYITYKKTILLVADIKRNSGQLSG